MKTLEARDMGLPADSSVWEMGLCSLRGLGRSHFSPSAICFPVHKVEMIIITFTAFIHLG